MPKHCPQSKMARTPQRVSASYRHTGVWAWWLGLHLRQNAKSFSRCQSKQRLHHHPKSFEKRLCLQNDKSIFLLHSSRKTNPQIFYRGCHPNVWQHTGKHCCHKTWGRPAKRKAFAFQRQYFRLSAGYAVNLLKKSLHLQQIVCINSKQKNF